MRILNFKLFFKILFVLLSQTVHAQIWDSLGTGVVGDSKHLNEYYNKLYVGGIDTALGVSTFNMSTWDGNIWESVGGGIDGQIYATSLYNNKLFIGGFFIYAGGPYPWPTPKIHNLTSWDGTQYYDLGYPASLEINSLLEYNNELFIGTNYVTINNQTFYGILKYNDTTWSAVGGGLLGSPREALAMIKYNGELVVGGYFSQAGLTPVMNIAKWNGNQWSALSNGLDYGVRAFVIDSTNNTLFAGGSFSYSDTVFVNHIAQWNGIVWQPVGTGIPIIVSALCFYKGELYAGGGNAWGLNPSSLYKWNGITWMPIIPAPVGNIYGLEVFQGSLYVSGGFTSIDGIRYSGIAKYTDTTTVDLEESTIPIFIIYPNPSTDHLSISYHLPASSDKAEIEIYDLSGGKIMTYTLNPLSNKMELDISALSSGIYIAAMVVDGKIRVREKLIVVK
jgi:trimeric autotransporter adhesin